VSTSPELPPPLTVRQLIPSSFLPAMIFEIGNGAMAPVLALTALHLGASPTSAGFTLSMLGIGQILGDIPASSLANRVGDRRAMQIAALVAIGAQLTALTATSVGFLDVALLLIGMSTATFYLARQAYITEVAPAHLRARAMSTLGGAHRLGLFLGPFIGAAGIHFWGLHGAYIVAVFTSSLTVTVLAVVPDLPEARAPKRTGKTALPSPGQVIRQHRRLFATLGLAVLATGAVRAARQTVIPLWAQHIGLSAEQTSIIFGIASAIDVSLFYPSGKIMDRFGRLAIAVPSMTLLGTAMMLLPLSHNIIMLSVLAMLMSAGNGLSSGIVITLGADVAPPLIRLRFFSIWRVMSDTGNALGPIAVSAIATIATLATGIVAVGAFGPLAAAGMARWVPRYSPFATRRMMRDGRREMANARRDSPEVPEG
jgi:MFS family permease